ncbi:MAG: RNA polymerase sigma factor [Bacteroidales bacterium]|nr:RNA polymerase sigma factor [Bacteroidales bacterium]
MQKSEAEIIEGCRKNNRTAQKNLYDKYCTAMYSTAYRICGDYEQANDILQDGFVQVFRDIRKFRGESTLGRWIKTIMVRTALRKIRNQKIFTSLDDVNHENFAIEIPGPLSGEYLEQAILSLPDGFRTVFLLIEVEGYLHKEVSSMLQISEGTSKSQLFHAKKRLQMIINKLLHVESNK